MVRCHIIPRTPYPRPHLIGALLHVRPRELVRSHDVESVGVYCNGGPHEQGLGGQEAPPSIVHHTTPEEHARATTCSLREREEGEVGEVVTRKCQLPSPDLSTSFHRNLRTA